MSRHKRNKQEEEKIDDSWLLPYADMLTLLLALFIVLFAMSEVDVRKFERLAGIFKTEFGSSDGIIDDGSNIIQDGGPVDDMPTGDELEDEDDPEEAEDEEGVEDEGTSDEEDELAQLRGEEFEKLREMQQELEEYIASNSLTDTLGTKLTGDGLLVTIKTDITFDSGSAVVKQEGQDIAKEIANFLDADPPHEVVISGHADDIPMNNEKYGSNWELSSMRAIQFMYLLLDYTDVEDKWFSARAFGEYHPIVPNTSDENRAINRRVEVLIQPNFTTDS